MLTREHESQQRTRQKSRSPNLELGQVKQDFRTTHEMEKKQKSDPCLLFGASGYKVEELQPELIFKTMTISQHPLTLYKTHFGDVKSITRKHSHSSYHGSDVLLRAEKTLFLTKLSTSYVCEAIFRIRAWERGAESCKMYTHKNHIMLRETYSGSPLGPLFCTISQSSTGWIYC